MNTLPSTIDKSVISGSRDRVRRSRTLRSPANFANSKNNDTSSSHSAVLIEMGSAVIRCGYVGEASPRHVIPFPVDQMFQENNKHNSVVGVMKPTSYLNDTTLLMNGKSISNHRFQRRGIREGGESNYKISSSMKLQYSKKEYEMVFDPLFERILIDLLLCTKIRNRRVIIIEKLVSVRSMKEAIATVLLGSLQVGALMFIPDCACPLYTQLPTKSCTGIVVDFGHHEVRAVAVYNSNPLIDTFQSTACGVLNMSQELIANSLHDNDECIEGLSLGDTIGILNYALKYTGMTENEMNEDFVDKDQFLSCVVPSSGKMIRVSLSVALSLLKSSAQQVADVIKKLVKKCPIDLRKSMANNILIVGGCSFNTDFQKEVQFCLAQPSTKSSLSFHFANSSFPRDIITWIGASIYGSLDVGDSGWTTQERWQQNGVVSLSDWSSVAVEFCI